MVLRKAKPRMYAQKVLCHTYTTAETLHACPADVAPEPLCPCRDLHEPTPQDRPVALLTIRLGNLDLLAIWVHLLNMAHLKVAQQDARILKSLILFLQKSLADGLGWL